MHQWFTILKEALKGKTASRTLSNLAFSGYRLTGKWIDIGGGGAPASHYRFMDINSHPTIESANVIPALQPDILFDADVDILPREDGSVDGVLLFNILEHLQFPEKILGESHRVLKVGGVAIGTVPFLVNVHPDPHDYQRYTGEKLGALFTSAGFSDVQIQPIGRGPFLAAFSQIEGMLPRIVILAVLPAVFFFDWFCALLAPKKKWLERFPLAYNFIAKK